MFNKDFYNLSQQVQGAIFQGAFTRYNQALNDEERANPLTSHALLQMRRGYAESPGWLLVQMIEFDPEPLTVEKFRIRAVYSAPDLISGMLELMASEKWLDRTDNSYRLAEAGREIWGDMVQRRHAMMMSLDNNLAGIELDKIERLMRRIVDASLAHPEVPSKWCLAYSRRRAVWYDSCSADRLLQLCGDFNAFRDDAHMSAYAPYNISGHLWEVFTSICDQKANTIDDLYNQLAYRGFSKQDWQAALDHLATRGWIELNSTSDTSASTAYQPTSKGNAIRDTVEGMTDHYFYLPWSCLTNAETSELHDLMNSVIQVYSS
ncbi:MAG: hypothetical protein RLP44_15900 [Aggregatilineales bacterium]